MGVPRRVSDVNHQGHGNTRYDGKQVANIGRGVWPRYVELACVNHLWSGALQLPAVQTGAAARRMSCNPLIGDCFVSLRRFVKIIGPHNQFSYAPSKSLSLTAIPDSSSPTRQYHGYFFTLNPCCCGTNKR